jgi:hypothetical protein
VRAEPRDDALEEKLPRHRSESNRAELRGVLDEPQPVRVAGVAHTDQNHVPHHLRQARVRVRANLAPKLAHGAQGRRLAVRRSGGGEERRVRDAGFGPRFRRRGGGEPQPVFV